MKRLIAIVLSLCVLLLPLQARRRWIPRVVAAASGPTIIGAAKQTTASALVSISYSPTAGNLIIVAVGRQGGSDTLHTVTDNIDTTGTNWIKINGSTGTASTASLWYKFAPSGLTTINTNGGTGSSQGVSIVHEVTGANATPITGGENSANTYATGTNPVTSNVTPATNNSLLFAVNVNNGTSATINGTGSIGTWNLYSANSENQDSSFYQIMSVANKLVATSGVAQAHGWTTSNTAGQVTLAVAIHP